MRVGLYDVDSVMPNLALMKLARFHKDRGDEVARYLPLFAGHFDKVYASKVFKYSSSRWLDPERMEIGGTGWDLTTNLSPEVDRLQPDYSLYDYPHSLGFTMRGCRFRCGFCVVPQTEGRPRSEHTIPEIWTQRSSDFVVLLDNDFFGNPQWRDRIAEIREHNLRVSFSQGLNIRIITGEQAAALASVRFRNRRATKAQVHFAWDRIRDEKLIREGIDRVERAGVKPWQMAFFVLVGFDTTEEQDLHRVLFLASRGCDPFVMPYDKKDQRQKAFARWVNHRATFKSCTWEEYQAKQSRGRGLKKGRQHRLPLFDSTC